MYKTEVFEKSHDLLKTRQLLCEKVNNTKAGIANIEAKRLKIKNTIADLKLKVPELKSEAYNKQLQKSELQKQTSTLKATLENVQSTVKGLKLQICNLKKQIVPDAEINNLKQQVSDLTELVQDLQQKKDTINKSIKDHDISLFEMQDLKDSIERNLNNFPTKLLQDSKKATALLQKAELLLKETKNKRQNLLMHIANQEVLVKEKLPQLFSKINDDKLNKLQIINIKEKEKSEYDAKLADLEDQENVLIQSLHNGRSLNLLLSEQINELFQKQDLKLKQKPMATTFVHQ